MARRLIGLDIGTNAVTIAEVSAGNPPRLERFGQVALPRDAMREGEVVDDRALIDAITRLRSEVDVKKSPVRLGLATPRAVVRQVEMPAMSRDELPVRSSSKRAISSRSRSTRPCSTSRSSGKAPATTASRDAGAARRRA